MILRTDRLTLRPVVPADAPDLVEQANDIDVARWLLKLPHPYTLADAQAYIAAQQASQTKGLSLAICQHDKVIGCIGTKGEFGYWLGQAFWGQGLTSEAALAVLSAHFSAGGGDLASSHGIGNDRSARVLRKCGFTYTGKEEQRVGLLAGQDHIHRQMVLTPSAWDAQAKGART